MIDTVKDYTAFKCFSIAAYVCAMVHFLVGAALVTVTSVLRASEIDKFSCWVDVSSTTAYKSQVEKTCRTRYDQTYNPELPLYLFVITSVGFPAGVCVIYSLCVITRVNDFEKTLNGSNERPNEAENEETSNGFCVFYFYFIHLVVRSLFGFIWAVLQPTVFYPNGFDFEFICNLSTSVLIPQRQRATNTSFGKSNFTLVACENAAAQEMSLCGWVVFSLNISSVLILFAEVVYLVWQWVPVLKCSENSSSGGDRKFVNAHLLRKRCGRVQFFALNDGNTRTGNPGDIMDGTVPVDNNANGSPPCEIIEMSFENWITSRKRQVLTFRPPDIFYAPKTDLSDLYFNLVIHTERAPLEFSKEMRRHEIFKEYTKVPESSIRLLKIEDLFQPNKDTQDNIPHTILAVGRPGIGKTALAERIINDWAKEIDPFYFGKIVLFYKFRWFSIIEYEHLSLETFLRYGAGQCDEKCQRIFQEIQNEPTKVIFIFDGLDELDGELKNCFNQPRGVPCEPSTRTSAMTLFIKLVWGHLLPGATILVTSRPTVDHFYSRLNFNRQVEIIGFTPENIKEYVGKFCDNVKMTDHKAKIWNHINSSSELLNLCYIPVNCLIVCATLSKCLSNPKSDTGSLTTLTKLYDTAVDHFAQHHDRDLDNTTLQKLQKLAFEGIEMMKLDFGKEHFNEQMKKSGLVNSSSNPYFPLQTKYCFVHLTIQEFLAARHVIETAKTAVEIESFITTHLEMSKWHLVLMFIAGLLGKRMEMSGCDYNACISTFSNGFILSEDGEIEIRKHAINLHVIKCLREIDDEYIVKNVCETNLNRVMKVSFRGYFINTLSTSDTAAICYVCKHLNNLKDLTLEDAVPDDKSCYDDIAKLLKKRCLQRLKLVAETNNKSAKRQLTDALMGSGCTLNHAEHVHANLTHLTLSIELDDDCVSSLCAFIQKGTLSTLDLSRNHLTSLGVSQLSKALRCCPELQYLNLSRNKVHEAMDELCSALIQGKCPLNTLILDHCSLTKECVSSLCEILCAEHCELRELSLINNPDGICDEGVCKLCSDGLTKEQCGLTSLSLNSCSSITDDCIPTVCETLQDKNCKLTRLSLEYTTITGEGKKLLRAVQDTECCKARGLKIDIFDSNYDFDTVSVL